VARQNPDAFIQHDPLEVAEHLLGIIAQTQPQVMITFDPYGFYGHTDHLLVHRAATAAFWAAERVTRTPPARLTRFVPRPACQS
jgi:N-acetyl-1-D-myo-inositol-2-amino-2-deoxy-alpha-D-glucopyranoside deacetylase